MIKIISLLALLLLQFQLKGQSFELFQTLQEQGVTEKVLVERFTKKIEIPTNGKKILLINRFSKEHVETTDSIIELKDLIYLAKIKNEGFTDPILETLPTDTELYLVDYPFQKSIVAENADLSLVETFEYDHNSNLCVLGIKGSPPVSIELSAPFLTIKEYEIILNLDNYLSQ